MRPRIALLLLCVLPALLLVTFQTAQAAATESVLYSFAITPDGNNPDGRLTFDGSGNLYGTTTYGGANGYGTVFELSPEPASGCPSGTNTGNGWCETVLYSFCSVAGCADGYYPLYAYVTFDDAGNLYGVDGEEHVFKLSFSNGIWTATNIHTFAGSPKDGYPGGSNGDTPAVDSAGNVYGTTYYGGSKSLGTVWKLTPVTTGKKAGTYEEKILHSFTSEKTGQYPFAGVTLDSSGNIYGTTTTGGKDDGGVIFKLAVSGTTYKESLLWSFGKGTDGNSPDANPILDGSGNLYGTTYVGGTNGDGTVFEVKP